MPTSRHWSPAVAAFFLSCLTLTPAVEARTCSSQSPAHRVALVELYTSEGCSSCPPADRWLGELSQHFSAEQLVALSLHVDYWDYIGWRDRFAQPAFAERQRWLTKLSGSSTVYTPEVFTSRRELRNWYDQASLAERIRQINRLPAAADIVLQMRPAAEAGVDLEVRIAGRNGTKTGRSAEAIVILYEDQLRSDVRSGENRGASLQHERVVRFWSAAAPVDLDSEPLLWRRTLRIPADWRAQKLGLAAFVQDARTGEVLQALAMPGCLQTMAVTATGS